jgi:hypothetical protein
MKIQGIRIYPQSVEVVRGVGAPIFVHGSVSDDYSDFFYAFRPLAALWRGHVFANDFAVGYDERGGREDREFPNPSNQQLQLATLADEN